MLATGKTPQYDMASAAEHIVIPMVSLYSGFVCKIHQKSKLQYVLCIYVREAVIGPLAWCCKAVGLEFDDRSLIELQ